ncbi:uncharacterized protein LOC129919310 [Episyrphus balteatus]|uniref:uncharacterized protein LOC129919310 n=1 Tax=Episyrphus balteatus TaxID=286459 RepID=UPI0024850ED2|nr:uncharacterized protein LOC129919310 [Episyrphus balteatus]
MNQSTEKATVAEVDSGVEMTPALIAELQFLLPYISNESSESEIRSPDESLDKSVEANQSSPNLQAILAALESFDTPLPPRTIDFVFMRFIVSNMKKIESEEERTEFKEWVVAEARHIANRAGGESESPVPLASSSFVGVDDALGRLSITDEELGDDVDVPVSSSRTKTSHDSLANDETFGRMVADYMDGLGDWSKLDLMGRIIGHISHYMFKIKKK